MAKIYLYFTIGSEVLDPFVLTEKLEVQPTDVVYKTRLQPPAKINVWKIDTDELVNSFDLRDHWKCLAEMIGTKVKVIKELTEEWDVKLDIVVETRSGQFPDIIIPGSLLEFVSRSRTILEICEYDLSQ